MVLLPHLTVSKFSGRKPSFCQYNALILLSIMKTSPMLRSEKCLAVGIVTEDRFLEVKMNSFCLWRHFRPTVWAHSALCPVDTMASGSKTGLRFQAEAETFVCQSACTGSGANPFLYTGYHRFCLLKGLHSISVKRKTFDFLFFTMWSPHPLIFQWAYWRLMGRWTIRNGLSVETTVYLLFCHYCNHMKGKKMNWIVYKGCHQKELPSKCYIINW